MKKVMAMVLSAALTLGLFAGCAKKDAAMIRVGSLKGPTTIGIVNLMDKATKGETEGKYEFTMSAQADEIAAKMISGDLDIALVPSNLAAVLYNKTKNGITAIDINTLGVLYCVTGDTSVTSVKDLAGKQIIMTGQATTPEYSIRYLLGQNNITDCKIEFKSEPSEVAAILAGDPSKIAILPQPFVTVACAQNKAISTAFSLEDEWQNVTGGNGIVTGVTVVRNDFLKEHGNAVKTFLKEHAASVQTANSDLDTTAALVVANEIVGAEPVAKKAIPNCNIVCLTDDKLESNLSAYLKVLYDFDPSSVGGQLPGKDFYFKG